MIRRDVLNGQTDGRVVKWALVASTVALTLGLWAEHTLTPRTTEQVPVVSEVGEVPVSGAVKAAG